MTIQCGECKEYSENSAKECGKCGCPFPFSTAINADQAFPAPLIMGILSVILWIFPILGFPVSIVGLLMSNSAVKKSNGANGTMPRNLAMIGLFLSIINAIIGGYLGSRH